MESLLGAYGSEGEDDHLEEEQEEGAGGLASLIGAHTDDEESEAKDQEEEDAGPSLSAPLEGPALPAVEGPARPPAAEGPEGPGGEPAELAHEGGEEAMALEEEGRQREQEEEDAAGPLPPEIAEPPPGPCDPELQAKVANWLHLQRTRGKFINEELRTSRGYRNPEFFTKMIEYLEIDEYGTRFDPAVWDPGALPAEDYVEALQKDWSAEEERRKAHRAASGRVDFVKSASQPNLAVNPLMAPGLNAASAVAQARAVLMAAAQRQR